MQGREETSAPPEFKTTKKLNLLRLSIEFSREPPQTDFSLIATEGINGNFKVFPSLSIALQDGKVQQAISFSRKGKTRGEDQQG